MQAVILAAGYGLRLQPFTKTAPKGLVLVLGKPLLAWTLESLPENIHEIIIVIGWLGEQIEMHFKDVFQGLPIRYVKMSVINGTGSALHTAKEILHDKFLVVNGDDVYAKTDLTALTQVPDWGMLATKTTRPIAGGLELDSSGNITSISANITNTEKWQNCGAYLTDTSFFNLPLVEIPVRDNVEYSLPHTLVLNAKKCPVKLVSASQWLPVGTAEELAKACKILDNM